MAAQYLWQIQWHQQRVLCWLDKQCSLSSQSSISSLQEVLTRKDEAGWRKNELKSPWYSYSGASIRVCCSWHPPNTSGFFLGQASDHLAKKDLSLREQPAAVLTSQPFQSLRDNPNLSNTSFYDEKIKKIMKMKNENVRFVWIDLDISTNPFLFSHIFFFSNRMQP